MVIIDDDVFFGRVRRDHSPLPAPLLSSTLPLLPAELNISTPLLAAYQHVTMQDDIAPTHLVQ